jgi:hypothetical protein
MDMDRIMGVLTLKAPVYRQIADDPNATQMAGIIIAVVSLISGFVSGLTTPITDASTGTILVPAGNIVAAIVFGIIAVILGLIGWFISSWVLAFVSKWFGGKTNTQEMLRVTGYVGLFRIVNILGLLALVGIGGVATCLSVIVGILGIIGYVIGVREAAEFSTGNAIISAIIAGIINAIIVGLLLLAIATPIVIALGLASAAQ